MLRFPPAPGRIVFLDTEFTTLDRDLRQVWEIGAIIRDPGKPDVEVEWQLRPPLDGASPDSLRIGGYYRRSRLTHLGAGHAYVTVDPYRGEDYASIQEVRANGGAPERSVTASEVAATVAEMLEGAYLVGAVPSADEIALHRFLAAHGQALTTHYRIRCVETLALGYLHGRAAEGRAPELDPDGAVSYRAQIPAPPWDTKTLSLMCGVSPTPDHLAHRALTDARWVREIWDAVHATAPTATSITGKADT